jgi:hypothetical protein
MEKFEKDNWKFLVVSEEGIIFYDPDTITFHPKGIARVWIMVLLTDKGREKEVERRKTRGDPIAIEFRINNAIVRVKRGGVRIVEYTHAKAAEKRPNNRFHLIIHPSARPEYLDGRWPKCF